tara:strand:- start:205440 stop:205544 length:105 start_codon:yes stop_codon:yes gene_type:complete
MVMVCDVNSKPFKFFLFNKIDKIMKNIDIKIIQK